MSIDWVWGWICANRDALIVEVVGIVFTVGFIEAILRCRERRKWSPMRRRIALDIGWAAQSVFMGIMQLSGLTLSDVIPGSAWITQTDPMRHSYVAQAKFFEQQYERDFETKYHEKLRQVGLDEWARFSESIRHTLTDLDRLIDLASRLFGPEVMTALSEAREQLRWAGLVYYYVLEREPSERDFRFVQLLASRMASALILLWAQVD